MNEIYDNNSARLLLGALLINPQIINDDKYPLNTDDFSPSIFHKRLFQAISNLAKHGAKSIECIDIYRIADKNKAVKELFDGNNLKDFISTIEQLVKLENVELYYEEVRKCSLLRNYKYFGFDTSKFENELEKCQIKDIVDYYEAIQAKINQEFYRDKNREEYVAGSDFLKTKEQMKESPEYGASFQSPYLNTIFRGIYGFILRAAKSGGGKAQPIDTIIPTPNGYKKLGDIKVGDYVFDRLGNPTKVLGVFPQGKIDSWTVTLSDGRKTKCNEEHLWSYYQVYTKNGEQPKLLTKSLKELMQMKNPIYIPTSNAVEFPEKKYKIDPYVIGSLLGNGCCLEQEVTISSADEENVREIANLLNNSSYKRRTLKNYSWIFKDENGKILRSKKFYKGIEDYLCRYSHDKSIPPDYKYGSIKQRFDLLQGLMDTDGNISYENGRYGVSFSTTSIRLAHDVMEILYSLGYNASLKVDRRENRRDCYGVRFLVDNSEKHKFFRISRKKSIALQAKNIKKDRHYNRIRIKNIEPDNEKTEMVCIYVDNLEHLYLTNDYIVTHNTIMSIGDLCKVTCTEYWDFNKNQFVKNKSRVGAGLFINTEMDMRKELDPIIISWISGVKRDHILDGFYTTGEEERVDYAAKILSESKLYIVDDPCFTTKSLVNTIREYSTLKQVKTVCFDYIQNNGYVASEIASETKVPQREDMVLLALTDRLKQIQRQCGVGLISAVQTNGQEDNMNFPTESCLAGSKAQVRKTDGTMAMLPPKKAELEIFDMIKGNNSLKIPEDAICNNVTHIIKGRSSKFPKYIKIFQYVDYGNSRCYDWCVTDKDGALIKIDKLLIEYDGRKII